MINRFYARDIRQFLKEKNDYCSENNIENDMRSFLFYNKGDICSPAYYFLHTCPRIFLANSKAFLDYHSTLDIDFQEDILKTTEIKKYKRMLKGNIKLLEFIKKIQKQDSIL